MYKILKYLSIIFLTTLFVTGFSYGATVLYPYQGGTGQSFFEIGSVLIGNGANPITTSSLSSITDKHWTFSPSTNTLSPTTSTAGVSSTAGFYYDSILLTKAYVTVCSSGCDYTTDGTADDVEINQALSSVSSTGGVVYVKSGDYNLTNKLNVYSSSTLFGDNKTKLINSGNNVIINLDSVDNSTVKNINLEQNYLLTSVLLASSTNCLIDNLNINGGTLGTTTYEIRGILSRSGHNNKITNNKITGNALDSGIRVDSYIENDESNTLISGNIIYDIGFNQLPGSVASGHGIETFSNYPDANSRIKNITIDNNIIDNSHAYSLRVIECSNCTVSNNIVKNTDGATGIWIKDTFDSIFYGNNISSTTDDSLNRSGVEISGTSTNNNIYGNIFEQTGDYGIIVNENGYKNYIHDNSISGYLLDDIRDLSTSTLFFNNYDIDSGYDLSVDIPGNYIFNSSNVAIGTSSVSSFFTNVPVLKVAGQVQISSNNPFIKYEDESSVLPWTTRNSNGIFGIYTYDNVNPELSLKNNSSGTEMTLNGYSGLSGSYPTFVKLNSLENGSWTANSIFSELLFANADASGAGDGGVKAKISAVVEDTTAADTGLAFYTSDDGTNILERIRLNRQGYLGINTTTPAYTLDINGTLRVKGTSTLATTTFYGSTASLNIGEINTPAGNYPYFTPSSPGGFLGADLAFLNGNWAFINQTSDVKLSLYSTSEEELRITANSSTDAVSFANASSYSFDNNLSVTGTTTISNGLVVDTNTLYVDSINNRVGIGTTTPAQKLTVASNSSSINPVIESVNDFSSSTYFYTRRSGATYPGYATILNPGGVIFDIENGTRYNFERGTAGFYSGLASYTLNVGRNSNEKLSLYVDDGNGKLNLTQDETDGTDHTMIFNINSSSTGSHNYIWQRSGTNKMVLNSDNGYLGIGSTTPTSLLSVGTSGLRADGSGNSTTSNSFYVGDSNKNMRAYLFPVEGTTYAGTYFPIFKGSTYLVAGGVPQGNKNVGLGVEQAWNIVEGNNGFPANSSILNFTSRDFDANGSISWSSTTDKMSFGASASYDFDNQVSVGGGGVSGSYTLSVNGTSDFSGYTQIAVGNTTSAILHIGEQDEEGGWFISTIPSQLVMTGGADYVGSAWTARDTAASLMRLQTGNVIWNTDSGLTSGSTFTPTQRMILTPQGQLGLGLGTSNPTYTFQMATTSATYATLFVQNQLGTNGKSRLILSNNSTLGSFTAASQISSERTEVGGAGSTDLIFSNSLATTLTEHMRILANGNVGIGTSTPTSSLEVYKASSTNGVLARFYNATQTMFKVFNSVVGGIIAYFGDDTNHTGFEADGTIVMSGNATVYDDMRVPLNTAKAAGVKDPGFEVFSATSTSRVWAFDGGTTEEELFFSAQVPHGYKLNSIIAPHIHLSPSDTNTGVIVFKLQCDWSGVSDGTSYYFNSTNVGYATTTISTGSLKKHIYTEFSSTTPITFATVSGIINCRLSRTPTGGDTYPSDVFVPEIDWHYEMDTIGSRSASVK